MRCTAEHDTSPCHTLERDVTECDIPPPRLSETRLVQAMRKIDPDLAHMIESLAPVYLVKG